MSYRGMIVFVCLPVWPVNGGEPIPVFDTGLSGTAVAINDAGQVVTREPTVLWDVNAPDSPSLSSFGAAWDLNDGGHVLLTQAFPFVGFIWDDGELTELCQSSLSTRCMTEPVALNEIGQAVGVGPCSIQGGQCPSLWSNGNVTPLTLAPGVATDINDGTQVVGYWNEPFVRAHGFIWEAGVRTDLGSLGSDTNTRGLAVNNLGQVVGISATDAGNQHCFIWEDGTMTDLGTLGGNECRPNDINDLGQVVGLSKTETGELHAFLWEAGEMTDMGTLGGNRSTADSINSLGEVLGLSRTPDGASHMVIWFMRERPRLVSSDPPDGHVDPGMEAGGIDQITFVLNDEAFNLDGSALSIESFRIDVTEDRTEREARVIPVPVSVDTSGMPTVVLNLSRPIPVGEWTTITIRCESAEGLEPATFPSIRIGHLPTDMTGDGQVTLGDATEFGILYEAGDLRADMDRNGEVSLGDASLYGQLWNGTSGHMRWLGVGLP